MTVYVYKYKYMCMYVYIYMHKDKLMFPTFWGFFVLKRQQICRIFFIDFYWCTIALQFCVSF